MIKSILLIFFYFLLTFKSHIYAADQLESYLGSGEISFKFSTSDDQNIVPKQLVVFDLLINYRRNLEVNVSVLDIRYSRGIATQQTTREYFLKTSGDFLQKSQSIQVYPSYPGGQQVEGVKLGVTIRNKDTNRVNQGEVLIDGPRFSVDDVEKNYDFVASDVKESLVLLSEETTGQDAIVYEYEIEASDTSIALIPEFRFEKQDDISFYYDTLEKSDRFDRGSAKSILRQKITVIFNRGGNIKLIPSKIRFYDLDSKEVVSSELEELTIKLAGLYFSNKLKMSIVTIVFVSVFIFYLIRLNRESLSYFYQSIRQDLENRRALRKIINRRDSVGLINYLYRFAHEANELSLISFFEKYGIDGSNISNEEAIVGIKLLYTDLFSECKTSEDYWQHFKKLSLKKAFITADLKYDNRISELN
ncbi:hypothetical protein [Halobacteriovorax sp. CON-3]|uniref:hypothetical protein n=1 Tax=Halobacteriovorax sp. CON-3 TaxID=3157710 RepID=UPI003717D9FA